MMMMMVMGGIRSNSEKPCTGELTPCCCIDVNLDHLGFQACDAYDKTKMSI